MTSLQIAACAVSCFRLTRLITDDKIFEWLRRLVVREAPKKLKHDVKIGIKCPFCVSFYWSVLIIAGAWWVGWTNSWEAFFWWGMTWGSSVLLNQIFMFFTSFAKDDR